MRVDPGALLRGLAVLAASLAAAVTIQPRLQPAGFDLWQQWLPDRQPADEVVVVAIDDASVAAIGHAPWPRARLAELMRTVLDAKPAAVGLEAIVAGPDPLSPARLMAAWPEASDTLRAELAALPDANARLAEAIDVGPVALAVAGSPEGDGARPPQAYRTPMTVRGGEPAEHVPGYPGSLASLPVLREAAAGQGAIDAPPDADGVVRRLPALVQYGGSTMPTLALELLRLASRGERVAVQLDPVGLLSVGVGERRIPTDADGDWWLRFPARARPVLPAIALLKDPAQARERLEGRIVLVGYTARGLQETVQTPNGPMPRLALQAAALDNVLGGAPLRRPRGAGAIEAGAALLLALGVVSLRRRRLPLLLAAGVLGSGLLVAAGAASFARGGVLFDVATPLLATWLALGGGLALSLAESWWQRRRAGLSTAMHGEVRAEAAALPPAELAPSSATIVVSPPAVGAGVPVLSVASAPPTDSAELAIPTVPAVSAVSETPATAVGSGVPALSQTPAVQAVSDRSSERPQSPARPRPTSPQPVAAGSGARAGGKHRRRRAAAVR